MSILVILLVLMIIGAVIAIETTNLLSSIVCVGAVGFLISIAFLFMGLRIWPLPSWSLSAVPDRSHPRTINRDLTSVTGDRDFLG